VLLRDESLPRARAPADGTAVVAHPTPAETATFGSEYARFVTDSGGGPFGEAESALSDRSTIHGWLRVNRRRCTFGSDRGARG
jgi:hypothetical protein